MNGGMNGMEWNGGKEWTDGWTDGWNGMEWTIDRIRKRSDCWRGIFFTICTE